MGSCHFLVKNCWNTQRSVGRCAHKSHVMKWANGLRVFKKNSLKLNAASHSTASWYADTDGFLEHPPSKGSLCYKGPTLQKIVPGFWASAHIVPAFLCSLPPPCPYFSPFVLIGAHTSLLLLDFFHVPSMTGKQLSGPPRSLSGECVHQFPHRAAQCPFPLYRLRPCALCLHGLVCSWKTENPEV